MVKNVKCNSETIHAIFESYIHSWDVPDKEIYNPENFISTIIYRYCFSTLIRELITYSKIGVGITDLWLKLYSNITVHYYTGK